MTNILRVAENQGLRDIVFAIFRFGATTIPQSKAYPHIAQSGYKYIYIYIGWSSILRFRTPLLLFDYIYPQYIHRSGRLIA